MLKREEDNLWKSEARNNSTFADQAERVRSEWQGAIVGSVAFLVTIPLLALSTIASNTSIPRGVILATAVPVVFSTSLFAISAYLFVRSTERRMVALRKLSAIEMLDDLAKKGSAESAAKLRSLVASLEPQAGKEAPQAFQESGRLAVWGSRSFAFGLLSLVVAMTTLLVGLFLTT